MNRYISILMFLIVLTDCKLAHYIGNNQSKMKSKRDSVNLYAFVGKKISLTRFDPDENNTRIEIDSITGDTIKIVTISKDEGFKAKYKVLKNIFNNLKSDIVEFTVYDHYGRPDFEKYNNVILYISRDANEEEYYHKKYQFDPLMIDEETGFWIGLGGESIEELFDKVITHHD